MRSLVVFRVDAGPAIGNGHAMRCLALADCLSEHEFQCVFVCQTEDRIFVEALIMGRYAVQTVDGAPREQAVGMRQRIAGGCALLVVDSYRLDRLFESECRGWADLILVIDDLHNRSHDCDLLLDQTLDVRASEYADCIAPATRPLLGPHYALLRPQFAEARPAALARRRANPSVRRILVTMGGFDPDNVTGVILAALDQPTPDFEVDVVLGRDAPHLDSVREAASRMKRTVRVHVAVLDMAALMTASDLAISAGGSTSWERCCLGLPSLIVVLADNQENIGTALDHAGAARCLGNANEVDASTIRAALLDILNDPASLSHMSRRAAELCDGKGAERAAQESLSMSRSYNMRETAAR